MVQILLPDRRDAMQHVGCQIERNVRRAAVRFRVEENEARLLKHRKQPNPAALFQAILMRHGKPAEKRNL
jgi:hypothetical protein